MLPQARIEFSPVLFLQRIAIGIFPKRPGVGQERTVFSQIQKLKLSPFFAEYPVDLSIIVPQRLLRQND
jgi:hypothetical protein